MKFIFDNPKYAINDKMFLQGAIKLSIVKVCWAALCVFEQGSINYVYSAHPIAGLSSCLTTR